MNTLENKIKTFAENLTKKVIKANVNLDVI